MVVVIHGPVMDVCTALSVTVVMSSVTDDNKVYRNRLFDGLKTSHSE